VCGLVITECGMGVVSVRQEYVENCGVWTGSGECETGICIEL